MNIGFYTGRVLIICNIIIRISSGGILNISNVPYMVRYELIVAKWKAKNNAQITSEQLQSNFQKV